jgi:hypothetical protein
MEGFVCHRKASFELEPLPPEDKAEEEYRECGRGRIEG